MCAIAGDAGDPGSIPPSRRSPGGGHGNPLQYSCLENPRDRGAWWAMVHRVTKSWHNLAYKHACLNIKKYSFHARIYFHVTYNHWLGLCSLKPTTDSLPGSIAAVPNWPPCFCSYLPQVKLPPSSSEQDQRCQCDPITTRLRTLPWPHITPQKRSGKLALAYKLALACLSARLLSLPFLPSRLWCLAVSTRHSQQRAPLLREPLLLLCRNWTFPDLMGSAPLLPFIWKKKKKTASKWCLPWLPCLQEPAHSCFDF